MRRWERWSMFGFMLVACSAWTATGDAQPAEGLPANTPAAPAAPPAAPVPEAAPASAAAPAPVPAPASAPPPVVPNAPAEPIPPAPEPVPPAPAADEAVAPPAPESAQVVSAQPSAAAAAPPVWRYSPHAQFVLPNDARRHVGFSLRVSVGVGMAWADRELARGSSEISGPDAVLNVDVGAAAIENLIVYARVGGFAFDHAFSSDSENAGSAFFGTFGAGVRYHFMPLDFYTSGTLALAAVSVTDDLGNAQNAGPGFGFDLEAGKNWWAGSYRERWCVGLGLRFAYMRSGSVEPRRGERSEDPWVGMAFSLVFSTAYN